MPGSGVIILVVLKTAIFPGVHQKGETKSPKRLTVDEIALSFESADLSNT